MVFKMTIHNIKSIADFSFDIPTQKGLYALTGENASGKSTIISCLATAFYTPVMTSYFGEPYNESKISFECGKKRRLITSIGKRWKADEKNTLGVTGFFEGSLVFGNRFKDIDFDLLKSFRNITESELMEASAFIRENLGRILHDNEAYYQNLFVLKKEIGKKYGLSRPTFFYKNQNGIFINQLNMSTGENLLITILHSLEQRIKKENYGTLPTFILLDEIELALHSASLRRLVFFLSEISDIYNCVVLFSTHSIELIRSILPENIYYIQRHIDNTIEVINPCYPIYATRNLESSNYGYDYIIMVEDELARKVVERILQEKRLLGNKRVLVIAVGGWHQVLRFAYDTIRSNLMLKTTKVLIVLDRDIKDEVPGFMKENRIGFTDPPHYLPVPSLEKYLLDKLTKRVDHSLFRELNDYVFQGRSLNDIVSEYNTKVSAGKYSCPEKIRNGKTLYEDCLRHEIRQIRKTEDDLIQIIIDYLFKNESPEMKELTAFFENQLGSTR